MLNIKEVEQLTGITKQNIRYYEKQGLLAPVRNPINDYREYGEEQIRQLKIIKVLRKLDMPLEEIRRLLHAEVQLSDAIAEQKERLSKEQERLKDALNICEQIKESSLEQFDVEQYLTQIETAEKNGAIFANFLQDYKRVVESEDQREFRFIPDTMCMNPSEFTDALCKFGNQQNLNLVITKEGMYPEFTIDGVEYVADREFSRFGAVVHCEMKYPDTAIPSDMSEKTYKRYRFLHRFVPTLFIGLFLMLLMLSRIQTEVSLIEVTVIFVGILVLSFISYRYHFNLKE